MFELIQMRTGAEIRIERDGKGDQWKAPIPILNYEFVCPEACLERESSHT